LVLLDLARGTETYLTDNDWNDYEAAWSPDGRYICWQSERLGHYESDIMVMDLREGRSWDLTNRPGRESDCRWTPESDGVIYIRFAEEGISDLYRKGIHGGEAVNLTRYPGLESPVEVIRLPDFMHLGSPDGSHGSGR
jgi:Tol biopolymer transport system component